MKHTNTPLIGRIQRDLFNFVERDPDDFSGLVEFWYHANSEALSAALTAQPGTSLILNVSSFKSFEALAKKLFLVADTLVLRDTRDWATDKTEFRAIPMPIADYRPGFVNETWEELRVLRPSPLTMLYRPQLYWTSETKTLNNGLQVAYAGWDYNSIPSEFTDWIRGPGEDYMKTGAIVYAPFIPPLPMELEFLNRGVDLPSHFGATSLFHQQYDWLTNDSVQALLSLKIPFLDGVDIRTISKIKRDNHDAFTSFSRSLIDSVNGIKTAFGTETFVREVRNIQRNQIDAAVDDVEKTFRRINTSAALRKMGILTGVLGLSAAAFLGAPETAIVTGLASGLAALVTERVAKLKDKAELKDKKGYLLWRLHNVAQ
jgi:hypothetical protein